MRRGILAGVAALWLAGCAMDRGVELRLGELDRCGVTGPVRDKVAELQPLTTGDIAALSRKHVSDGTIVGHVQSAGTVYYLKSAQVAQLRRAGVSEEVVDYLMSTPVREARRRQQAVEFQLWASTAPWYYGPAYGYPGRYGYAYRRGYPYPGPYYAYPPGCPPRRH